MKRKLTDNIPLKMMSVAVGIMVWLLVVNVDNPIVTKSFTILNVDVINGAYIENNGMMAMQEERQDPIRVTIKAERKSLSKITSSDIHAVADLQQALSLKDPVMVPIMVTVDKIQPESIEVTPRNLSIHIQEKDTQEFVVNVTRGETKPAKGFDVASLTSNPEKIKITGPTSLLNKIDKVNAFIDINNDTEDKTEEVELSIIDKNGDVLSDTEMSYLNVPKVIVTARLWRVRSDVKIHAEYSGAPAEGYMVDSVSTTPDVVSVAGSEEALDNLEKMDNTIWIPAENVDISGRDSDVEVKIKISEMLSEGLKLISDSSEDVFVRVNILPEGSLTVEIPTKDIEVVNPPNEMQVTFETAKIEIRVKELEESPEDLKNTSIKASINLEGKEEGSYEVPVDIQLPTGYELVEGITTEVSISEISDTEQINE